MAIPNTFTSGTKAKASEVNENFTYLSDEIVNERTTLYDDYEVLSGCLVTVNDPEDTDINIASGKVIINGVIVNVAEQLNETLSAADGTNPRYDVICVDTTGVISVITGTPAATPTVPEVTANKCPLATILRPAGNNNALDANLYDGRYFRNKPYIVTNNTDTTQQGSTSAGWYNKKTLIIPPFVCRKYVQVQANCTPYLANDRWLGTDDFTTTYNAIRVLLNDANLKTVQGSITAKISSTSTYAAGSFASLSASDINEYKTSDDVDFEQFNTFKLDLYRNVGSITSTVADIERLLVNKNNYFVVRGE